MDHKSIPAALPVSLLLLRLGVAVVMIVWTADKIINPDCRISGLRTAKRHVDRECHRPS
jgi:hypothetical protein